MFRIFFIKPSLCCDLKKGFYYKINMRKKLYIKNHFRSQTEDGFMKKAETYRCYD